MSARVLIADTDENLLASYQRFLNRRGFHVATATDALRCVARMRSFHPDILVLAPHLPWGGGEGVLAMMYEEEDVPFVPVLVLDTAFPADGRSCVGAFPVSGYHLKPLTPRLLEENVLLSLHKYQTCRHH